MKQLIFALLILTTSCDATKRSAIGIDAEVQQLKVPDCIKEKIMGFKTQPVQNPPRKVYGYMYKGIRVYYVTAVCCDQYSDLYDRDCNLIAHPDGGITGKGDGRIADFNTMKTEEELVWQDQRR